MDKFLENLKSKNIHIVGVSGAEGSAILEFFAKSSAENITAHDFSADRKELKKNFFKTHLWLQGKEKLEAFENFLKFPAILKLKDKYLEGISHADIIFIPSSWRLYKPNFPKLAQARAMGIEFSTVMKLYFQLAKGRIISVTGTKGKGTTSNLIYDIFSGAKNGNKVYLAGNDRRSGQELEKISKMGKDDILVLETSNRQLMVDLDRSPDIGVITNISPDHIDEHGSFEKYIKTKKSLFRHLRKGKKAVLNYDNEITRKIGEELKKQRAAVFFFGKRRKIENGTFIENGKIYIKLFSKKPKLEICDLRDIKIIGEHNVENILAAALVSYLAGAKPEEIKKAVQNFHGLPHRLEFIGEYGGVRFYDDLASTNPESTIAAIKAMVNQKSKIKSQKLFLVSGGDDKGMEYNGLAKEIIDKVNILILLPGTGTDKLAKKFKIKNSPPKADAPLAQKFKIVIQNVKLLKEALDFIGKNKKSGDIVLISPASAHFQSKYIDSSGNSLRRMIAENFPSKN